MCYALCPPLPAPHTITPLPKRHVEPLPRNHAPCAARSSGSATKNRTKARRPLIFAQPQNSKLFIKLRRMRLQRHVRHPVRSPTLSLSLALCFCGAVSVSVSLQYSCCLSRGLASPYGQRQCPGKQLQLQHQLQLQLQIKMNFNESKRKVSASKGALQLHLQFQCQLPALLNQLHMPSQCH